MIYLDSSVALAHLFAEDIAPPPEIWTHDLVSSRLFAYEVMNRTHARGLGEPAMVAARTLIDGVELLDLSAGMLRRALDPFPVEVRTLDALHLATMVFLRANDQTFEVATYDRRLGEAAVTLGFKLTDV